MNKTTLISALAACALFASSAFAATAVTLSAPAAPASAPAAVSAAKPAPALQTLPSGVVVKHLVRGTGAQPKATDTVQVHYRGTLANGTEFDSSYKRNAPASFALNQVVPCWTQGVAEMKVGGKAELTCPAATAYGAQGAGGVVPPNAVLTFQVELLAVKSR